jgi:cold-inducible RNA-binding protein
MNIYVGNLPFTTTDTDLEDLFSQFGQISRAAIITDRETGRSRGFGFVEMENDEEGKKAIEELNEKDFDGRQLTVNEARPRAPRAGGGGGGYGSEGGGGYSGR